MKDADEHHALATCGERRVETGLDTALALRDILWQCQQGPFLRIFKKELRMPTVAEIFEAMPTIFNSAAAAGMTKTFQWNITGEQAGVWAFKVHDGVCEPAPGGVEKPDVTFTISDKDWIALTEGKLDAQNAFFSGQLKIAGDMGLALKVPQLFPTPRN
jgi:putative sterol carrier protein